MQSDRERFNRFFHGMLDRGVYLAPALYEAGFTIRTIALMLGRAPSTISREVRRNRTGRRTSTPPDSRSSMTRRIRWTLR